MKRGIQKTLVLVLSMLMLASLAAGCSGGNSQTGTQNTGTTGNTKTEDKAADTPADTQAAGTTASTASPTTVTFCPGGEKTDRMREFVEKELNPYLKNKYNITFNLEYIPWGETAELRMASGEDLACFGEIDTMSRYVSKGYLTDMTSYVQEHGKRMLETMDPLSFEAFQLDGKQYGLPIGNKNNVAEWYQVVVRQDLLEEAGMKEIKNSADLEAFYAACKALHPEYEGLCEGSATEAYGPAKFLMYEISDKNVQWLDPYTFVDVNSKDDKVYSWLESEEFKNLCAITSRWQQQGIMTSQWISDPQAASTKFNAGQGMFRNGNAGRPWEVFPTLNKNVPEARLVNYRLGDYSTRPRASRGMYATCFLVSSSAKNPESYVKIINDMYENQETYDFWTYGIKGTDYDLTDSGRLTGKKNDGVVFNEWVTCNVDYIRWDEALPQEYIDNYMKFNEGCVPQKDIGYAFNMDSVKDVYAQIEAVRIEYFVPMITGVSSYEENYAAALQRLKDAGLDTYLAEYQKQFSDFYAKKNP